MNEMHLPPLPFPETISRETCYVARLYLAIWSDLSAEQQAQVRQHLRFCAACMAEYHLYENVNHAMSNLPFSAPSARVDQAVMAAIVARSQGSLTSRSLPMPPMPPTPYVRGRSQGGISKRRGRGPLRVGGLIAAAIIVACVIFAALYIPRQTPRRVLLLPASLSWTGYVLYEVQNNVDKQGQQYHVIVYYNLGNKDMNVETVMDNSLDVVMISDSHEALGLDMMHHVAQWDASNWAVDESAFDLNNLKRELRTTPAAYEGTMMFEGQQVYRIRDADHQTMLLDKDYMPVNVLNTSGMPMYQTLKMLSPSQVPDSMWNMSIPAGFQMGTLPARP